MDSRSDGNSISAAPSTAGRDQSLDALIGQAGPKRRLWPMVATGALLALLLAGGIVAIRALQKPAAPAYATAEVRQGDLLVTVSATGALKPLNQVDVGSELSGAIESVLVEDNDVVAKGQILATLDTAKLNDQIALGEASLASAQANLRSAEATVKENGLKRDRARQLWNFASGPIVSRADVDAAEAAYDRAAASVNVAQASVSQAQANLRTGRTNLSKATIRSPIAGVVLTRKVEPGQTVAASLQAPVLFTLAENLAHMELEVDIDEAEIANVRPGQDARFTVDAYMGRYFPAKVARISLGAHTTNGVVSYTGVLRVENPDLSLRPGMTASVEITSDSHPGVLMVPDAALRFSPPQQEGAGRGGILGALTPRMPGRGGPPGPRANDSASGTVWVLREGKPSRLRVRVGATDGSFTEISGPEIKVGLPVIVSGRTGG